MARASLTDDEKRFLYHNGCVVVRGAVDPELVERVREATRHFESDPDSFPEKYGTPFMHASAPVLDVLNKSSLAPILREVMGDFDLPTAGQYMPTRVTTERDLDSYTILGYKNGDMPYRGSSLHIDAVTIISSLGHEVQEGSEEDIYERWLASGPKGDIGRCAEVVGHNNVPLFMDPEMTLGVSSFTCFVCVACSDQLEEGVGQTMVVPGGHFALERFFRWQASQGAALGPEGPGWPRLDHRAPNRCGHVFLPPRVCEELLAEDPRPPARTADGRPWVVPTPVNLRRGDALICLHCLPHTMSRNDSGTESRKQVIFRLRNKRQQPRIVHEGLSPCPDRTLLGGWREYEAGNDPFARSRHHLLNMWDNWDGMQEVVARESQRVVDVALSREEARRVLTSTPASAL
mmetsp:Transcript_8485/g.22225  ORF Transcript_8485/g.22225 Transcript_8485/m.22225 type:complete len:404 (-) Transcript_8485:329-1540(-)